MDALIGQTLRWPDGLVPWLTWDRDAGLVHRVRLSVVTEVAIYFCDSRSFWQRAGNKNINGPLRQDFFGRTGLSVHIWADFDAVAFKLDTRPRKTLGFQTPGATLAQILTATG